MPKDPFADDPNDPASFIEDDEHVEPLTAEERFALNRDLELVQEFAKHLSPRGIDGIFMFCEDCEEPHFYEWDIMASNMKSMLNDELSAVTSLRSEEHTSELQSRGHLVCRLLPEKKKIYKFSYDLLS